MIKQVFSDTKIAKTMKSGFESFENILTSSNIDRLLSTALERGGQFAEIYAEYSVINGISLEENKIRQAQAGISMGLGIRVIDGEKTGYAYSERFEMDDLVKAAKTASFIASGSGNIRGEINITPLAARNLTTIEIMPDEVAVSEKANLLRRARETAHNKDKRIYQVQASIWDGVKIVVVANSDGFLAGDQRTMTRFNVSAYAIEGNNRQAGRYGGGGRVGFEHFSKNSPEYYAEEAVRQALILLSAKEAPAGPQAVVLGNGWAGILLHEAIGHGLEADFNRKGTSLYSGRVGEKTASDLCTVVDDGTIPGLRGSINIDDEGTESQRNVLIEKGILRGYLTDRLNSKLMGSKPTGSGRRESYRHYPMPRMTNTFMLPGNHEPDEIIKSVKKGLYAKSFGGGEVDISNGQFVFQVTEGYAIEDGKITYPVKGANLIGSGPEVLKKVVMVGNDLKFDSGVGTCGKDGQSVPVGVGIPTCKVSEIVVGGTEIGGDSMMGKGA
ncbi:MAG: metalloprotease TldD [candidate division Zixibacteria bacterium]